MAFSIIPGLDADDIEIQLPAQGDTDWAINLRDLAFKKIAQHDHSGSGNGQPVSGNGIAANSITGTKILLNNDEYLRWKNSSATATNVIRLAADDKIELAQQIDLLNMSNNVYITGRNNANSANINLIKVDTNDDISFGAEISAAKLKQDTYLTGRNAADNGDINLLKVDSSDRAAIGNGSLLVDSNNTLTVGGQATLTDNTSSTAVSGFPTLSTDQWLVCFYKLVRNGSVRFGQLSMDEDGTNFVDEYTGDDVGVSWTNDSGTLDYTTTSTGNDVTFNYMVLKG